MNKGPGALGCRAPWLVSDRGPIGLDRVHPPANTFFSPSSNGPRSSRIMGELPRKTSVGRGQECPAQLAPLLHLQWEAGNRIGPVQWLRAPLGTISRCRVPAGGCRDIPEAAGSRITRSGTRGHTGKRTCRPSGGTCDATLLGRCGAPTRAIRGIAGPSAKLGLGAVMK